MTSLTPLVSVCCITYNHEKFIRQAIDSFLEQNTNFPIEIIIHDDASTDNTVNVICEYQKKYPDLIKTILQSENQYSVRGFGFISDIFKQASGKYIALCEGDDYWTDPLKLQLQVELLNKKPYLSACFHNVIKINHESQEQSAWYLPDYKDEYSTADLLSSNSNFIATGSVVFRNRLLADFPTWLNRVGMADWILHIMNSFYGSLGYIDRVMGVYRLHPGGVWSTKTTLNMLVELIYAAEHIRSIVEPELYPILDRTITSWQYSVLDIISNEGDRLKKKKYIQKSLLKLKVRLSKNNVKYYIKLFVLAFNTFHPYKIYM